MGTAEGGLRSSIRVRVYCTRPSHRHNSATMAVASSMLNLTSPRPGVPWQFHLSYDAEGLYLGGVCVTETYSPDW